MKNATTDIPTEFLDEHTLITDPVIKRYFSASVSPDESLGWIIQDRSGIYHGEVTAWNAEGIRFLDPRSLEYRIACYWLMLKGKLPIQYAEPSPQKEHDRQSA